MQFRPALVPEEMLQQLADSVEDIGPGKSLANTIELAQSYYDASDTQATCAVLVDFVDRVLKWSSTPMAKIESDLAGKLTSDAAALMGAIGCN